MAEQRRRGPRLLKVSNPVPIHNAALVEDRAAQLLRALLVLDHLKRRAALVRVGHERHVLALLEGGAHLTQAISALEVTAGAEELHELRGADVRLERADVLQSDAHGVRGWFMGEMPCGNIHL